MQPSMASGGGRNLVRNATGAAANEMSLFDSGRNNHLFNLMFLFSDALKLSLLALGYAFDAGDVVL